VTRRPLPRLAHPGVVATLAAAGLMATAGAGVPGRAMAAVADQSTATIHTATATSHTATASHAATAGQAAGPTTAGWVGTWAASPQQARPADLTGPGDPTVTGFDDQTVREIVHISIGGTALRIHLSNAFSSQGLMVGAVSVAAEGAGAELASRPVTVTFHGGRGVRITAGGDAVSDLVRMRVAPLENLAVSIYLPGVTGPTTNHDLAEQVNYVSTSGDHASDPGGQAFPDQAFSWFYLSGIDVRPARANAGAVVALGDSITDGYQSTTSGNDRWPDALAARLAGSARPLGVLNEGISGGRVLGNSVCFGTSALSRLDADVLDQAGARAVILLEGINDIGFPTQADAGCTAPNTAVTAQQIIAGYRQIIARAHARGLRVIGATLTPIGGSAYWTPGTEQERLAVNAWIRHSHAFDGVIDFDQAVRDPADPHRLLPAYDSGDHLHPNDTGYLVMGEAISLRLLRWATTR
jgi:lysophospholipase L1-like esterase